LVEWNQPGKAIKASECLAISAFLWCMPATAFTSPTVSPVICTNSLTTKRIIQIITQITTTFLWVIRDTMHGCENSNDGCSEVGSSGNRITWHFFKGEEQQKYVPTHVLNTWCEVLQVRKFLPSHDSICLITIEQDV